MPELEKKDENLVTYREMMDKFRRVDDGYSSYNSYRHHKSIDVWVRDATAAQKTRPTQGVGIKIKNNRILMRCLSRLRAVDYAISHASDLNETERETIRALIKTKFDKFQSDKSHVVQKEQAFNTFLIEQLHAANLTEGCFDAAAAGALLKHYEILSHVLDAAMPIVTFEYDEQTKNLEREIQYPVTWKTGEQKKELEKLKIIKFNPSEYEINAHTRNPVAMQRADACFAELLINRDRMLPAGARETHPMGAKDAFVVQRDSLNMQGHDMPDVLDKPMADWKRSEKHWYLNKGAVAFYGAGETAESAGQYATANLEQIAAQADILSGVNAQQLALIDSQKQETLSLKNPHLGDVEFLKVSNQTALAQFEKKKTQFSEALRVLPDTGIAKDIKASGLLLLAEFSTYEPKKKEPKTKIGFFVHKAQQGGKYLKERVFGGAEAKRSEDLMLMTASIGFATDAVEGLTKGGDFYKAVEAIDRMNDMQKVLPGHERLASKLAALALILSLAAVVATCIIFPPVFAALLAFAGTVSAMTGGVVNPLVMILTTTLSISSGLLYAGQTKGKASALEGFNLVCEAELGQRSGEAELGQRSGEKNEEGDVLYITSSS